MSERSSNEKFANKAADILFESLSELPAEEQDRRLDRFEEAVNRTCSSHAKEQRSSGARGFLVRTLERVGFR